MGGSVSGYVSVPDDAPLERKLRFLIDQAIEAQKKLDHVESRLRKLPAEWGQEIAATRSALEEQIAQELQESRELFIGRRLTGLACIVIGSVMLGIVNLLR
jgi:hypothetical protein